MNEENLFACDVVIDLWGKSFYLFQNVRDATAEELKKISVYAIKSFNTACICRLIILEV
jgi:hypothetical protein